jgi:hypothetical protein
MPDCLVVSAGEQVYCGVCGTPMKEHRNVNGPRSFAMAMAGMRELHDVFECPNREADWHIQGVELRKAAKVTPSARIAKILTAEAEQVLASRVACKESTRGGIQQSFSRERRTTTRASSRRVAADQ